MSELNDFTDFYYQCAIEWYRKREYYRELADSSNLAHAECEFENYRKAAGLPENWIPNDN